MTWSKFIVFFFFLFTVNATSSDIMLLGNYTGQNVQNWVMSEKPDGIRGYWMENNFLLDRIKSYLHQTTSSKIFHLFQLMENFFPKEPF